MRPHRSWIILAVAALGAGGLAGCSTTRSGESRHPGVVEKNPNAVIRTYPASATRVAWALTDVMKKDPILEDVQLMVDPQSNDSRSLSHQEREALGLTGTRALKRDVNYNITAKAKNGHRVGVLVLLKGEREAEVSMLYGAVGDAELSRALLDSVDAAMTGPLKDPGLSQASASRSAPNRESGMGRTLAGGAAVE